MAEEWIRTRQSRGNPITGDPLAPASALETIDEDVAGLPGRDLREGDGAVETFYVSRLDSPMFTEGDDALVSRERFPESHPPNGEHIEYPQELVARKEAN
ncbi:MAG: heat shock protein HtpX [Halobacteriales archaeon]|jgi:heat shock protein HtpX